MLLFQYMVLLTQITGQKAGEHHVKDASPTKDVYAHSAMNTLLNHIKNKQYLGTGWYFAIHELSPLII